MENDLKILGEAILEAKHEIAKKVHEIRLAEATEEQKQIASQLDEQEVINIRANFVARFGEALVKGVDKEKIYNDIEQWGKETGQFAYSLGVSLDEALGDTAFYRTFISEVIEEAVIKHNLSVRTVFASARVIDPLLDHAVYCFSLTYIHFYKETLENAKTAFIELSVPVVPLSKGIAVLPLIGNMDTERAGLLMEETLKAAKRLNLTHLILDLSGVLVVDTMVADQIFKVIDALKLLGVQTILTGIRPEIAQTVVSLGLDFSKQVTWANLQQALVDVQLFHN
ncbi:STAS domain-containing protein [Domibacillus sp. DTU_2020_1001157_1_SI_ALB_TIR_016]|uniref:STAS domain-containing protein n=1 Tax=Domibacillus sp. DTU_2020_1001157_1_SI_ALB_TIR_016 TaxID=3077789 RepID=UPI0028EE0548|nr:STAS domain-containing protein [Domibacillus sp. DTU_2020_1001157_1_SI_ALB_TIR_016]WNS79625.1 STAS domain-containing protein [Domibacillus sp. DTU_2020_1001157_1_SI_ALB_TIR_016]